MTVSFDRTRTDEDELPLTHLAAHITASLLCWAFVFGCGYLGYRISQLV